MHVFKHLHHLRALRSPRKEYEPLSLIDMLLDADLDRPVHLSFVEVTFLGLRARSHGRTGFAALRKMRQEHPALVQALCAYVGVSWFVAAAIVALMLQGR
ncbi:hypothetical protein [Streptomyces sp. NPDC088789]|uniref:hypothetical protein n=1 Tax=Streptomyces sp. NPDC088789 TaxID=3365899 RepID=UPI003811ACF4